MQRSKYVWHDDVKPQNNNKNIKMRAAFVFIGAVVLTMVLIVQFYILPKYMRLTDEDAIPFSSDSATHGISITPPEISDDKAAVDSLEHTAAISFPETFEYVNRESDIDDVTTIEINQTIDSESYEENTSDEYIYSLPVPESAEIDDEYFKNAVFIGDSRTNGLAMHSGMRSTFWGHVGLNVSSVLTEKYIPINGEKVDILTALTETSDIKRVYISLGINELGWYSSNLFIQRYKECIAAIREALPDAVIYVQLILPISKSASDTAYASDGGNEKIKLYNSLIANMAAEISVYYLDVFSSFADEDGYLPEEVGFDGVHLNPQYYKTWADYLRTHTVDDK